MSTKNSFFSDCRSDQTIERMTFLSGQSVAMKCPWNYRESLFWIRIVPGTLHQVLGKAFGSKQTADLRIRITEENGASLLRINRVTINDVGYYYCLKYNRELTFSKEIHLRVEGKVNENYIFLNSCTFKTHCRSSKRNSLFLLLLLLLCYYDHFGFVSQDQNPAPSQTFRLVWFNQEPLRSRSVHTILTSVTTYFPAKAACAVAGPTRALLMLISPTETTVQVQTRRQDSSQRSRCVACWRTAIPLMFSSALWPRVKTELANLYLNKR